MSQIEIKVPDIGGDTDVPIIEVLVNEGDKIEKDQSLITLESDKASMEIPAEVAGTVASLKVKVGDKVSEGSVILTLEADEAGDSADSAQSDADKSSDSETTKEESEEVANEEAPAEMEQGSEEGDAGEEIEVKVPDIGGDTDVPIIEVLVSEGDEIEKDQSLITLESEKASMEIPSTTAGKVTSVKVKVGDKLSEGDVILTVQTTGSSAKPAASKSEGKQQSAQPQKSEASDSKSGSSSGSQSGRQQGGSAAKASPTAAYALSAQEFRNLPHASPSVRKFARELGVDLTQVEGSGRKSRILREDVQQFVKSVMSVSTGSSGNQQLGGSGLRILDWPKVDFSKFGETEAKPLSRIKKISGANLHRNWVMIPHVTNNEEADITELETFRKDLNKEYEKEGIKFTMLAFLIKAVTLALKKFPEFNTSLDDENLIFKKYYNIGFAADTPNGLVVPVIFDADKKTVSDIAQETRELAKKARDGKLSSKEMQGGCFSISSLGGIGGTHFTPIINAPEVAILGVSRQYFKPVWNGKEFEPRLMLPLSLSYDHRVIDGAAAARFNVYLSQLLSDFRRAMI